MGKGRRRVARERGDTSLFCLFFFFFFYCLGGLTDTGRLAAYGFFILLAAAEVFFIGIIGPGISALFNMQCVGLAQSYLTYSRLLAVSHSAWLVYAEGWEWEADPFITDRRALVLKGLHSLML